MPPSQCGNSARGIVSNPYGARSASSRTFAVAHSTKHRWGQSRKLRNNRSTAGRESGLSSRWMSPSPSVKIATRAWTAVAFFVSWPIAGLL